MSADELFTRDELLNGLVARRARTLLFLIESRAAHLKAQSRRAAERFLTEEAARERDLAFLEAFSLGRQPPLRPTIQDLERFAPQWGALIPDTPRMRAGLAHYLAEKYRFTQQAVPGIRRVLGLDDPQVKAVYERLYGRPLDSIYAPTTSLLGRLRWGWAALSRWLESLPPFWTVFALTLTETVGAGVLALPIALAGVGPLPGLVLLVVLGLVNVLTVAYMAEAVSRSGTIRYGSAYIGRAVRDYLGSTGANVLSFGSMAFCFLLLWAYYIGFSTTMADVTHLPAAVWVVLILLIGLYFVRRNDLGATVTSALVVGAVNIGLILAMSLLAFTHLRAENLAYFNVPFIGGRPFDPSLLGLIFGTVLSAYFGHMSVSNCARSVMKRDASGRSLIWGCVAAQGVAIVIYTVWVLAVNSAVAPDVLRGETGTALIPLAREVGAAIKVLGTTFTVLGVGMGSVHSVLGLFNLTRERLPLRSRPVLTLGRRRGRLILERRRRGGQDLRIGLTYLGLRDGEPRLRLDVQTGVQAGLRVQRIEVAAAERWEGTQLPGLLQGRDTLVLETLQAGRESVRLRVNTSLGLAYEGEWDAAGLGIADVLVLPAAEQQLISWLMRRQGADLAQIAAHLGQDEASTREALALMADDGLLVESAGAAGPHYRVLLGSRRGRAVPGAVDAGQGEAPEADRPALPGAVRRLWDRVASPRGRFVIAVAPVVAVSLLAEWSLLTGTASFAGVLSFLGVIVVSLLAGVFPVLLLISSRRKGDFVPGTVYRFLGHPLLLAGVYLFSLLSLFAHGLLIWENPVQRLGALAAGVGMLILTLSMWRRGAFAPRAVVTLCQNLEQGGRTDFSVLAAGRPVEAEVRLAYADGERQMRAAAGEVPDFETLRHASFDLPDGGAYELKVWAYRVTAEGDAENLPGRLDVHQGDHACPFDLGQCAGPVVLPADGGVCRVEIGLGEGREA